MIDKRSRYARVDVLELEDPDGHRVRYLGTRFIPNREGKRFHVVRKDERLDRIAYTYHSDPQRFWLICDANLATWPDELLEEPGRRILIPSKEG